jgi:hypothetical protein
LMAGWHMKGTGSASAGDDIIGKHSPIACHNAMS